MRSPILPTEQRLSASTPGGAEHMAVPAAWRPAPDRRLAHPSPPAATSRDVCGKPPPGGRHSGFTPGRWRSRKKPNEGSGSYEREGRDEWRERRWSRHRDDRPNQGLRESRQGRDRLNLSVRRGEVYGFLGPNGAGKTTPLRMLLGRVHATSGPALCPARPPSR